MRGSVEQEEEKVNKLIFPSQIFSTMLKVGGTSTVDWEISVVKKFSTITFNDEN